MKITSAGITADYQHKKTMHYVLAIKLENDPSRYEITIYRDGSNIIPVTFSKEDCPENRYWYRSDGEPNSFIKEIARQSASILNI